jgi:CarboxypepD_reg-like domain/TonB-dependent Receptor Plug Domain
MDTPYLEYRRQTVAFLGFLLDLRGYFPQQISDFHVHLLETKEFCSYIFAVACISGSSLRALAHFSPPRYHRCNVSRIPAFACAALAWAASAQTTGQISGLVVDARGGETLARVEILLDNGALRTTTADDGKFHLAGIAPGDYVLNVSTVGYHLAKKSFHLDPGGAAEFEIVLSPDTFHQTDSVEVQASPFDSAHSDSPSALVLAGNDAKNLASVLADDPLRAVQSLPGVTSNNDFDARFSMRGAGFNQIGFYLDGVLLHQPFHMIQGQSLTGSGTSIDGDVVEAMELTEGAFPARFADRTAAVLDMTTRDGSVTGINFRASASVSNAGLTAEGPFGGKKHRGSWLTVLRKSYLQYLLARTFPDTTFIFGLEDAQTRLSYDPTSRSTVTLYFIESFSDLNRPSANGLGINSILTAGYDYTFANLGYRYSPTERLSFVTHAAWMREKFDDHNPQKLPTAGGYYGEWVWNSTATWMWNAASPLEVGWSVRRLRDDGFANSYQSVVTAPQVLDRYDGTGLRLGGYAQQSWTGWSGRLHFTAGLRWDRHSVNQVSAVSPSSAASVGVTRSTSLQFAFGQYVEYPDLSLLESKLGSRSLLPARSNQVTAAVEQRLSARTRIRAEFYNRADRDLAFQPLADARVLNGKVFAPSLNASYFNSERGWARGAEIFLQHSTANRLTGWVSYAFGRTLMSEGVTQQTFPSDYDQRHSVNVYGGYRLRPSVNVSVRWSYGSGFPIPGYLEKVFATYYLWVSRDQARMPFFSRTDLRVNKAFTHDKWKFTLYGELINLTDRTNYVFESFNGFTTSTRQAYITLDKMFPILPSAGVVFER